MNSQLDHAKGFLWDGVVLRYEEIPEDEPPPCDPAWFVEVVEQALLWAAACIAKRN